MCARIIITFLTFCFWAGAPWAAEVESLVSSRETYVGAPVVLQIRISNASKFEPPSIPEVDGLEIRSAGTPSRSSQTSIVQDSSGQIQRSMRSTVTFSFHITPQREGAFTIPPIKVVADGLASITKAVRIIASKSETDDLMFVEVDGQKNEIFVGEALDLTLKIWVRPYRDKEFQVTLDDGTMWQSITDQSKWSLFEGRLKEMEEDRQRPRGTPVLRKDSSGNEREYWLFEIVATLYRDRPDQIDGGDVRVILDYPVALGRSRSFFGSKIGIAKSRPIVADATVEPITVKPIPDQGRPDDYRGAVGRYTIITEAKPAKVKAGDPVTLHLWVDGTGPMDLVRAPPLASQQSLIEDFKVPDEPLAGFVDGERKVFSTTIRPLHEGVTQVPPISMSYFDPEAEEFVTVLSDPIPIEVEPADVLALHAIVGARPAQSDPTGGEQVTSNGLAANLTLFSGEELLTNVERPSMVSSSLLIAIVVPPLILVVLLAFVSRHLLSGLVSARRRFQRSLASSQTETDVSDALETYLARRFRLSGSRLTRDQTVGQLRALGYHDLAICAERLYASCEKAMFSAGESVESLRDEAVRIVDELKRKNAVSRGAAKLRRLSTTSTTSAIFMMAFLWAVPSSRADAASGAVNLSADQQGVLLNEALSIYVAAAAQSVTDKNRDEFAKSAEKFQLLVDSGLQNDRVYFNLATARLRAGQLGHAIANYRRALRLDPANQLYRENLAWAERRVADSQGLPALTPTAANDVLLRFVSPHAIMGLCVLAWTAFWGILALRVLRFEFHWKSAAFLTLCCFGLTAASYLVRIAEFVRDDTAVLVIPEVSVRGGDGAEFAEITALSDAEGRLVKVLDQRGDWMRISLDGGTIGWIPVESSEQI